MEILKKGIFYVVLFFVLAIFNTACFSGETPNETYPATPDKVVNEFCKMDYGGARIGWGHGGFEDYSDYILWDDEPGWDGCSIISGFDIKTLKSGSDTARISVTYHVLGEFTGPYKWKPARKERTIIYLLKKDGGRWRIAEPMTSPHVSIDTIIKDLERTIRDDPDKDALRMLKKLKQVKKNWAINDVDPCQSMDGVVGDQNIKERELSWHS